MNIIHVLEQLEAILRDVAPILKNYKNELKKQGFSDEEAFELVRDYQKLLFQTAKGKGG